MAQPSDSRGGVVAELLGSMSRPKVSTDVHGQPFAGQSWAPPSAPQVAAKPAAPPFPFKYAGRLQASDGASKVYLQKGNDLFAIGAGDLLDGGWRIDAVTDDRIDVTFMAGEQRLSMLLSSLIGEPAAQSGSSASFDGRAAPQPAAGQVSQSAPAAVPTAAPTASSPFSLAGFGLGGQVSSTATSSTAQPARDSLAPTSGSMPTGPAPASSGMQIGPAPSGAMPMSPAPSGILGSPAPTGILGGGGGGGSALGSGTPTGRLGN